MGSYGRIGDGLVSLYAWMFFALIVLGPLGIWKLVDLVLYVVRHLRIGWGA